MVHSCIFCQDTVLMYIDIGRSHIACNPTFIVSLDLHCMHVKWFHIAYTSIAVWSNMIWLNCQIKGYYQLMHCAQLKFCLFPLKPVLHHATLKCIHFTISSSGTKVTHAMTFSIVTWTHYVSHLNVCIPELGLISKQIRVSKVHACWVNGEQWYSAGQVPCWNACTQMHTPADGCPMLPVTWGCLSYVWPCVTGYIDSHTRFSSLACLIMESNNGKLNNSNHEWNIRMTMVMKHKDNRGLIIKGKAFIAWEGRLLPIAQWKVVPHH